MQVVLLCGGMSTRMGQPKHLMHFNERPVLEILAKTVRHALPYVQTIYVSLRSQDQTVGDLTDKQLCPIYDSHSPTTPDADIGPAAGLLAAFHYDSKAHWLVIACDYPLISSPDLMQLVEAHEGPVTCFENAEHWPEPLLAIWSPSALSKLEDNVQRGVTGPIKTIRECDAKRLKPIHQRSLMNANTPAEWETASRIAEESGLT